MKSADIIQALKISDINISSILVANAVKNKRVKITYQNKPLICQTPFLEVQTAVTESVLSEIKQFNTIFSGDTKRRINAFYQFIEKLELYIENQVAKNGNKWFPQTNIILKSLIRENADINFIRWPFDIKKVQFIDESKHKFDFDKIKPKDLVKIILEISDLWIDRDQFGLIVITQKIMVKPFIEKIKHEYDYVFNETRSNQSSDSDSESDVENPNKSIISLFATDQKPKSKSRPKINPDIINTKQSQVQSCPTNKILNTNTNVKVSETKISETHACEKVPNTRIPEKKILNTKIPETKIPETKISETKIPETKIPETKLSNAKILETKLSNTKIPEVKVPEVKVSEVKVPEAKVLKVPEAKVLKVPEAKVLKVPEAKFDLKLRHGSTPKNIPDRNVQNSNKLQKQIIEEPIYHTNLGFNKNRHLEQIACQKKNVRLPHVSIDIDAPILSPSLESKSESESEPERDIRPNNKGGYITELILDSTDDDYDKIDDDSY